MGSLLPQFTEDQRHPDHIAEVIETTSVEFLAQCLESDNLSFPIMPAFGSWVKSFDVETNNKIYGIVCYVTTTPIDSVHRARALGLSLTELREQQPQIFAMLKTEFRAVIVGFESSSNQRNGTSLGQVYQYLPPRPPQIHQGVYRCQEAEIIHFSENLDFLRILLQVTGIPADALIAAIIRHIYQLRKGDRDWLIKAGRTLNNLLQDDYDSLQYIFKQIHL